MTYLGLMLLALGLGDLAAGDLAGRPRSLARIVLGVAVVLVTMIAVGTLLGLPVEVTREPLALVASASIPWFFLRAEPAGGRMFGRRRAAASLVVLVLFLVLALTLCGRWADTPSAAVLRWQSSLPVAGLATQPFGKVVLVAGVAALLTGTANGIVRAVLVVANTQLPRSPAKLNGGRYIGALERLLIFGLAVAGEPTAAALIISAKSLLRFPELSRGVRSEGAGDATQGMPEVDALTEYFLLGSLLSWSLALCGAALIKA